MGKDGGVDRPSTIGILLRTTNLKRKNNYSRARGKKCWESTHHRAQNNAVKHRIQRKKETQSLEWGKKERQQEERK